MYFSTGTIFPLGIPAMSLTKHSTSVILLSESHFFKFISNYSNDIINLVFLEFDLKRSSIY